MTPEIVSHLTVRTDSLELGTPSKGGVIKIYFDSWDPVDAERRIREAFRMREIARALSEGGATA